MHRSFDSNRLDATLLFQLCKLFEFDFHMHYLASTNACVCLHMDRFDHFDHQRVSCTLYSDSRAIIIDAYILLRAAIPVVR